MENDINLFPGTIVPEAIVALFRMTHNFVLYGTIIIPVARVSDLLFEKKNGGGYNYGSWPASVEMDEKSSFSR